MYKHSAIHAGVAAALSLDPTTARAVGGGSINDAFVLGPREGQVFVKCNDASRLEMFEAEAEGLAQLGASQTLRVPDVIATGVHEGYAWLALEGLDLGRGSESHARLLGQGLAAMHRCQGDYFGWHRNNTIGSTAQINNACDSWPDFFREHRLEYQLALAGKRGAPGLAREGLELCAALSTFFADATFSPRLLHGDLWGGNWGVADGEPVVYDPAVYYGDPETDIAMTELFGGFAPAFYDAYRAHHPDTPAAALRRDLYRLYHVLNHYNLFGGAYANQAAALISDLRSHT